MQLLFERGHKARPGSLSGRANLSMSLHRNNRLFPAWLNIYSLFIVFAAGAVLFLILAFPLRSYVDTGVYLETARKILNGQLPYVNYEEINLPTIHYLNVLPLLISHLTPLNQITAYFLLIWAQLAFSCFAVIILLSHHLERFDNVGIYIIPIVLIIQAIFAQMLVSFGQREHIIFLAFVPWFVVRWYRWNGGQINRFLAFSIGFMACLAASIKPYFVPLFLICDLYWFVIYRRFQPLLRPEIYGALTFALIFAIYFVLLVPQVLTSYFTHIMPDAIAGYSAWGTITVLELTTRDAIGPIILAVLPWLMGPGKQGTLWKMARPLSLALAAVIFGYVIQRNDYPYHRMPMDGCSYILFGLLLYHLAYNLPDWIIRNLNLLFKRFKLLVYVPIVAIFVFFVNFIVISHTLMAATPYTNATFQKLVTDYSNSGDAILVIDTEGVPGYPGLQQLNRGQASRYLFPYPLPYNYCGHDLSNVYTADSPVPRAVSKYLDDLVEDIRKTRPPLIFIRLDQIYVCPVGFRLNDFLEAHSVVASEIRSSYKVLGDFVGLRVYLRTGKQDF